MYEYYYDYEAPSKTPYEQQSLYYNHFDHYEASSNYAPMRTHVARAVYHPYAKQEIRGNAAPMNRTASKLPSFTRTKQKRLTPLQQAESFISLELCTLKGMKRIIYESSFKFGRLEMDGNDILLIPDETREQCVEGLARLWQMGDGYIFVCHQMGQTHEKSGKRLVYMSVYHVSCKDYRKLSGDEAEDMVSLDPFWKREMENSHMRFT